MVTQFPGSADYKMLWLATGTWGTVCLSSVLLKPNVLPEEHVMGGKPAIEMGSCPCGGQGSEFTSKPHLPGKLL